MSPLCLLLGSLLLVAQAPSVADGGDDAPRARRQVERLMNAGLPFAEKMLAERGEFFPFGAVLLSEGKIRTVGAGDAGDDASSAEVYERLIDGIREGAGAREYRAAAVFALVELRDPADGALISAVHVALEHESGYCVDVYYPTVVESGTLVLGEAFAGRRSGTFFESCDRAAPSSSAGGAQQPGAEQ